MSDKKLHAAYKIFHALYGCKIPLMDSDDNSAVNPGGMFIGDASPSPGSLVAVYRTIADIATLVAHGSHVKLDNWKDAVPMYDTIMEHMEECVQHGQGLRIGTLPPREDMVMLDRLAGILWPMVRYETSTVKPDVPVTLADLLSGGPMDRGLTDEHLADRHESLLGKIYSGRRR